MKFAVRFYTKTGNTKRLAEAIAKEKNKVIDISGNLLTKSTLVSIF